MKKITGHLFMVARFSWLFNTCTRLLTLSISCNFSKLLRSQHRRYPDFLPTYVVYNWRLIDNSWVSIVNAQQIKPSPLFLGFVGFQINQTGEFDVTLDYKPQSWFTYASGNSIASVGVIFAIYLYVSRDSIRSIIKKICEKKGEASR